MDTITGENENKKLGRSLWGWILIKELGKERERASNKSAPLAGEKKKVVRS